ncbi:sensor histidine kinase [Ascidiimonas sp. W6]|uniref:sensor histidine kinase n=1 Tax=Ascidiimonas meishanensis TaxID=3128903 RepID=UPI0030EC9003
MKTQKEINKGKLDRFLKDQEIELIRAAIDGQDKERKRIAQELHDNIGGNLAAIRLQLNNIVNPKNNQLNFIKKQLDETYEQVRNLSHDLIPKKFSKNKFSVVLEEYLQNIEEASNLNISFSIHPREKIDQLDEVVQMELFRIIQELVTNTLKHAKAKFAELHLNLVQDKLNLLFEDNGVGFNAENLKDGIGLDNIKCRLKKLNGVMVIDSKHERGTVINIEIPKSLIFSKNG